MVTRSWAPRTHPCPWESMASLSGPIPQKSQCRTNWQKKKGGMLVTIERYQNTLRITAYHAQGLAVKEPKAVVPTFKQPRSQSDWVPMGCVRQTSQINGRPIAQSTAHKASTAHILKPDTTAHPLQSHTPRGQNCPSGRKGTCARLGITFSAVMLWMISLQFI